MNAAQRHMVHYTINGTPCQYEVIGPLAEHTERCLLEHDDNLAAHCAWNHEGYVALDAWPADVTLSLRNVADRLIRDTLSELGIAPIPNVLEELHHTVNDASYAQLVQALKTLPKQADLYFPVQDIDRAISGVLDIPVSCRHKALPLFSCSLRIVRPGRFDNNPLHRDAWLDRLRHGLNLYIPLAGSNALSSLSLLPKSHYWPESVTRRTSDEGCSVNGISFTVPSITDADLPLAMIRPILKENEILLFSPYNIHGGAQNWNKDMTRISLEMRFWRQ